MNNIKKKSIHRMWHCNGKILSNGCIMWTNDPARKIIQNSKEDPNFVGYAFQRVVAFKNGTKKEHTSLYYFGYLTDITKAKSLFAGDLDDFNHWLGEYHKPFLIYISSSGLLVKIQDGYETFFV